MSEDKPQDWTTNYGNRDAAVSGFFEQEKPVLPANPPVIFPREQFKLEELTAPIQRNVFDNEPVKLPQPRSENPYCNCGKHLGLSFHETNEHDRAVAREEALKNARPEHHDSNTLFKVFDALGESGLDPQQSTDAINAMQNKGILFRERR